MKTFLKRFLKVLLIVIIALVVLMVTVPYLFKGDILKQTKTIINSQVDAEVEFADFKLSLFKHFPNLSIDLTELSVSGKGKFASDTLVKFESFTVAVDLMSVFDKNIRVEGIYLIEPRVHGIVAKDSTANWDIVAAPDEQEEEVVEDTSSASTPYRIQLKQFQIRNASVTYEDSISDLYAYIDRFNFNLSGDLGADSSYLDIRMAIEPMTLKMGAIKYLNEVRMNFEAGMGANVKEGRYHFLDNRFSINELDLNFEGLIEMAEENKIFTDVTFHTNKPEFKHLLSLVPAIYTKDFADLETSGQLSLSGKVSGFYQDEILPTLDLNLLVEDAMINYPDLPKNISNIQISLQTYFDGANHDHSIVNLEKFSWELGGNPFDASFKLTTPISDPTVQGLMDGKIDLATFSDVLPMQDTELKGLITSDLSMKGSMSMIEQERYEQFKADGGIQVRDLYFASGSIPVPVNISAVDLEFSPQYVALKQFSSRIGESDLNARGRMENFLAFALDDGTIRGDFSVKSSYFNANEFLSGEETEEEPEDTLTQEMTVFEVPENIDFKLDSRFDHIVYDKMDIRNAGGTILVKDRTVYLDDFNMDLFDGSMAASGEYNTQNPQVPKVNFDLAVNDLKIEHALQSFSMLDTIAPIMRYTRGDISLKLNYMSQLQSNMQPDVSTVNGYGNLRSDEITLEGSKSLGTLLQALKLTRGTKETFRNLDIEFLLQEGKLIVKPFDTRLGNLNMTISGSQSLNQTMDYLIDMDIPKGKLGKAADEALNNLISQAISKDVELKTSNTIGVKAKLTGKFSDPKVNLVFGKGKEGEQQTVKEQVKDQVKEKIDAKKEEVKEKAREEAARRADQIVKEAQQRAEQIRQEARKAAEKIRKEADAKADKIEKEAEGKNVLLRKAAEKSAEEVRKQADRRAQQLINEADERADQVVAEAKEKAEKIKNQ